MKILFTANQANHSKNIKQTPVTFAGIKRVKKITHDFFVPEMRELFTPEFEKIHYKAKKPVQWAIKRALDFSVATVGIMATSPVMLITAAAIKLDSKGPVIFKQTRIGQYGKPFTIYKFRTMFVHEDKPHFQKIKDDPRVTRVGRFIRKYSLDELPQFFNVLKGDISLVGPRPISIKSNNELLTDKPEAVKRYVNLPGAILNYNRKEDITEQSRVHTKESYLKNWHLGKDIKHFLGTIKDFVTGNNF